jgi:hypothetical protein
MLGNCENENTHEGPSKIVGSVNGATTNATRQAMLTPPYVREPVRRFPGGSSFILHSPTSDRWLARFLRTDNYARDACSCVGWRGIMLVAAVLMVGAFAGSVEGDRGDGCHRTSCYQRYDRDYQMAATPTAGAMLIAATPAAAVTARVAMVGAADGYGGYGSADR